MKVEYKKDLHYNFMVISELEAVNEEPYCIKLQKYVRMDGLLPMERRNIDNQVFHYYNITGIQSIRNLFEKGNLSYNSVKNLFLKMLLILEKGYEYLLNEDDFILNPEYVFMDVATNAPNICYLSGYRKPIQEQISCFIEYVMNKVDYNDKEAVLMVYGLYSVSKEERFTLDLLYDVLNKSSNTLKEASKHMDKNMNNSTNEYTLSHSQKNPYEKNEFLEDGGRRINQKTELKQINPEGSFMMEKIVGEKEIVCYSWKTYLYTGICGLGTIMLLILSVVSKLLYNSFGNRIDYSKLFGVLLLIFIVDGYILHKIWDKKMRVTKIVTKNEYIDPLAEAKKMNPSIYNEDFLAYNEADINKPTIRDKGLDAINKFKSHYKSNIEINNTSNNENNAKRNVDYIDNKDDEEVENPTCILNDFNRKPTLTLKPLVNLKEGENGDIIVNKYPFFIGKLTKNVDLFLSQDVISRYHAKITNENDRYYLTDLNSTNGTYHNGLELLPYETKEIKQGDEVAFANISFQCQFY